MYLIGLLLFFAVLALVLTFIKVMYSGITRGFPETFAGYRARYRLDLRKRYRKGIQVHRRISDNAKGWLSADQRQKDGDEFLSYLHTLGLHPRDLNARALDLHGADPYGDYWLFKCRKCGHPFICDFEHGLLHGDITDLNQAIALESEEEGEKMQCPKCNFRFRGERLWEISRDPLSATDWLVTPADVSRHQLEWLKKLEPDH